MESLSSFPLDYRITPELQEHCHTVQDVKPYLQKLYASTVGVEFEHIRDEEERLWLYSAYE